MSESYPLDLGQSDYGLSFYYAPKLAALVLRRKIEDG